MKVKGVAWVGCPTENMQEARHFFENILGLQVFHTSNDDDMAMFQLASGQFFEVLGAGSPWYKYLKRPVIAFEVDDVP